ncbi:hypothetical protein DOTSEDRAFT_56437 [Dothistroma septosporum NZE10]|uniref:Uncharacterized protein n=1 Tax=Dothistroma septosporum (strain NZE10 / CBS 128990) TaxID=675120 RepID=N1PCZ4_DOTSN|nr:hypothetical protein DOTSEDRAFT_56437 [Dothistroma septosporum NZE10]
MSLFRFLFHISSISLASASVLGAQDTNGLFARHDVQCAVAEDHQPDWYKRNLKTVRDIYDLTVYPNQIPILLGGGKAVPPGLFAPDAKGRVSPVGEFDNFEDSIEYFFALAPTPFSNNASTAFYDAQVVDFVSSCPSVASSLVYFRTGSVDMLGKLNKSLPTTTLSQVSFWHFNPAGEVDKYQSWVPNLQAWTKASSGIDYTNQQVQDAVAGGLCPTVQQRCQGKDQQFKDVQDCTAQLGAKSFGNFDEAWGDNLACRTIHIILTMVRPDVHCPHVGPTGGGKCIDIDYSIDYFDDANLFKEPEGTTFTCGPALQPDNQIGAGPGATKIFQDLAKQVASGKLKIPEMGGMSGVAKMPGMPGATGGQMGHAPAGSGQEESQNPPETGTNPKSNSASGATQNSGGIPGDQNPACESCREAENTPTGDSPEQKGANTPNQQSGPQPAPLSYNAAPPSYKQQSSDNPTEESPGQSKGGSGDHPAPASPDYGQKSPSYQKWKA